MPETEPWLRGPIPGVSPFVAPVLFSLQQTSEDLARWTEGLSQDQVWAARGGLAPLGFQLKHIAGSIDRLLTYAEGASLSEQQMTILKSEAQPEGTIAEMLDAVNVSVQRVESFARSATEARLAEPRGVGRKQLPTTVIGLLVHIAEHTQRHVGQAIATVRVLRANP